MDIHAYVKSLRERLAACRRTREEIAVASGGKLSASWISKFAAGARDNPTVSTLAALDHALRACEDRGQAA